MFFTKRFYSNYGRILFGAHSTKIFIYADGSERIVEFIFDTNETVPGLFLLKQNGLFLMEKKMK